ncbi:hypothetical protein ACFYRD_02500 [Streptomyces hirsutus]|uniref:hypothetical protein n=1 Tax=Streptomyces hirsutus TaxID=35620 RepID=UPI0036B7A299
MTTPEEEPPASSLHQDTHPDTLEETLTKEQSEALAKLATLGYKKLGHFGDDTIRFAVTDPSRKQARLIEVDAQHLQSIASNIDQHREHQEYRGITSRDGTYVEFLITHASSFMPSGRIVEQHNWSYPSADCDHVFNPWFVKSGSREYSTGFHIRAPRRDACIELSEISPVFHFLTPTGSALWPSDYTEYTLKVWVNPTGDTETNSRLTQQTAHSLLFELDARHGLSLSLASRALGRAIPTQKKKLTEPQSISFPSIVVPREVAALFSFAGEAFENPPFAFLSYYQVLEYYMPLVSRRDALRRIRREIRDFTFDISDDVCILRILNSAERTKGVSEEEALKILVRDCAREDRLTEFFKTTEASQHFSRKGPISGVPAINLNLTTETVSTQAARRIYALRNRIVHAKDDPRYAETPQLLPRSAEANSLGPDIRLARFLALETVIDNQD